MAAKRGAGDDMTVAHVALKSFPDSSQFHGPDRASFVSCTYRYNRRALRPGLNRGMTMTTTRAAIRVALGYGSASCWAMMAATGAMAQDVTGQTAAANAQPSPAAAQNKTPTPDAQSGDLGEIVVTGIRASMTTARAIKRDSDGIVDAIAPEDIGKLPDTNLAESLQRITGVSIDRSGGEGEFITVRGFGPEFNTVLVNRRQIA
ncbi:MAG: iron complex outerrane recepter protein, partial [Gammaproteobacteria bacterium]|nr:iron complex outerrane recepter protein [Gammaproteobacteria bacterium]